ncbi:hypothetical protein ACFL3C_01960 [Patescibacteria group bacterium]
MTEDRDKELKKGLEEGAQPETDEPSVKGDAATKSAAAEVVSPFRFDPEQMKNDMEVIVGAREDDDTVRELATLYAGLGKVANSTAEFDPNFKLPPEGKAKLVEAMNQLGDEFFEALIKHYNELESLVDKFLHELKTKGVFFLAQSTPDHYRCNQQFRIGLLEILEKMTEGRSEVSNKQLCELSEKYSEINNSAGFDSKRKSEFRKKTGLMQSEDRADTLIETCESRVFIEQLGVKPKEVKLKDKALAEAIAEVEESFTKYFTEEKDTADFLAAIIKRLLEHQANSIAGQTISNIRSDENMSLTFDDEDEDGEFIDNPSAKLKYLLARTVQVIRVMRFIKYQKKLFRLKDES